MAITSETKLSVEELKGYMTIKEVSIGTGIKIDDLYKKLEIPDSVPEDTKLKDLKNFVDGFRRPGFMQDTISVESGKRWEVDLIANNPGIWPLNGTKSFHQTNNGEDPGGMITKFNILPRFMMLTSVI
jgi:hypothetical protein